jgi:hypothetical protein
MTARVASGEISNAVFLLSQASRKLERSECQRANVENMDVTLSKPASPPSIKVSDDTSQMITVQAQAGSLIRVALSYHHDFPVPLLLSSLPSFRQPNSVFMVVEGNSTLHTVMKSPRRFSGRLSKGWKIGIMVSRYPLHLILMNSSGLHPESCNAIKHSSVQ